MTSVAGAGPAGSEVGAAPSAATPRFGLFLSQSNKMLSEIYDDFQMAEDLGFDHAWLPDHLTHTDGGPEDPVWETWTLITALAARTSRIRLGLLVASNTFRHPSVLTKSAVTLDHVSGGRLILGLGSGWYEDEHRRYGIDFPPARERVDRLEEAVQVIRLLMDEEPASFRGRHYRLDEAYLQPRPLQQPRIPILIAAHRPRMLAIAARYADQWDTFAAIPGAATDGVTEDVGLQIARLDEACRAIGRDPATIRRSTWTPREALASEETYIDFVERHHRLGFTDFSVSGGNAADRPMLKRIGEQVLPDLRASLAT